MLRTFAFSVLVIAAGCAGQTSISDGVADEAALAAADGKTDAAASAAKPDPQGAVAGSWALSSSYGDIWYLWLRGGDATWAWTRCSDAACNDPVVEMGTYKLSTSSGRKYITFLQATPGGNGTSTFDSMYAYKKSSSGLQLRRVRASSWMTFDAVSDEDLCNSSGGAWANGGCSCGAWPMAWSPGAGGCWQSPAVTESACDDTKGIWSDDDANAAGTFCDCGYGRVLTDSGCVDL